MKTFTSYLNKLENAPIEVKEAAYELSSFLNQLTANQIGYYQPGDEIDIDEHLDFLKTCKFSVHEWDGEWFVGDSFENGVTGIYKDGKWFYRDYWTGADLEVNGGIMELMADLKCSITA